MELSGMVADSILYLLAFGIWDYFSLQKEKGIDDSAMYFIDNIRNYTSNFMERKYIFSKPFCGKRLCEFFCRWSSLQYTGIYL